MPTPAQASQKTLPVAVALIAGLAPPTSSATAAAASAGTGTSILAAPGAVGLACVAAVVAHLMQVGLVGHVGLVGVVAHRMQVGLEHW